MVSVQTVVVTARSIHNTKAQRAQVETVYSGMDDSFLILLYNTQEVMNYTKRRVFTL